MAELADAVDSKSTGLAAVGVRPPLWVPTLSPQSERICGLFVSADNAIAESTAKSVK